MSGRLLAGPFLTRAEAASRAGLPVAMLPYRPDLIRIGGRLLPEAYCGFQFSRVGVRRDIGSVVLAMRGSYDDLTIADWLVKPITALRGEVPLTWLNRGGPVAAVVAAACAGVPQASPPVPSDGFSHSTVSQPTPAASHPRSNRRRRSVRRPLASH